MRNKITNHLKKCPFTLILIVAIWYLSLFTPPETRLDNVRFIDKWVHILMYGTLSVVLWVEVLRMKNVACSRYEYLGIFFFPIIMGGLVELVQAYCTTNRTGDWLDFLANTVGAVIGSLIVLLWKKRFL